MVKIFHKSGNKRFRQVSFFIFATVPYTLIPEFLQLDWSQNRNCRTKLSLYSKQMTMVLVLVPLSSLGKETLYYIKMAITKKITMPT